ncbi:MAG: HAMP domain-containing protein [Candidatus Nanoarchaeia archaeon]
MKIRVKLLIAFIVSSIVLILIWWGAINSFEKALATSVLDVTEMEISDSVILQAKVHVDMSVFSESDVQKTQAELNGFLNNIISDKTFRVKIWDRNKRIIASDKQELVGKSFSEDPELTKAFEGGVVHELASGAKPENIYERNIDQVLELLIPMRSESGEVVGVIETYTTIDDLVATADAVEKRLRQRVSFLIALALLILSLVFLIVDNYTVRPIIKMLGFARKVGKGDIKAKISIRSDDEFEDLADALNKMLKDLCETSKDVRRLESAVKERTKKLRDKVEELEKFQRLTVGRELKMAELKKRIKELEK